ncbi:hypothetical protein BD770DRAFT_402919, partial [Pilaira anomala]
MKESFQGLPRGGTLLKPQPRECCPRPNDSTDVHCCWCKATPIQMNTKCPSVVSRLKKSVEDLRDS